MVCHLLSKLIRRFQSKRRFFVILRVVDSSGRLQRSNGSLIDYAQVARD